MRIAGLLILVVLASLNGNATTCVSNKKFKVRQVCGVVTDPTDVAIPKVDIALLDHQSVVLQTAVTDEQGRFTLSGVPKGDYALRVKSPYFEIGWQPITVTKTTNAHCGKPMPVRLELAGGCSSISKPK